MKTIAVTDLDAYRYFRNSEQEWVDFAARLMRREPESVAMSVGTDLHELIHDAALSGSAVELAGVMPTSPANRPSRDGSVLQRVPITGGFAMPDAPQLDRLPLRGAIFEVPVAFHPRGVDYHLFGYIDAVDADGDLWEFKSTTSGTGWSDRYMDSMQWRAYMLGRMAGTGDVRLRCHYAVFQLRYRREDVLAGGNVQVQDVCRLTMDGYAGLESDVSSAAREFADFVDEFLPAYWRRRQPDVQMTPLSDLLRGDTP